MTKIVLVDDHFMVRDGIRAILEDESQYSVIGEAVNGLEAISLAQSLNPDIIICDIRMPEMSGIETVQKMKEMGLEVKTIMLSMHDSDEYILQSINAGADGYLLKGASKEEFLKALSMVNRGEKYFSGDVSSILVRKIQGGVEVDRTKDLGTEINVALDTPKQVPSNPFDLTKRESQILHLAISGMTNKDIATELNISKRTTEVHRFNLMKKMGVKNVLELSNKARKFGMIS
ncbi:response regulator [Aquimarina pacifica]|uniref:response regulator n=1 Tax=Aquimarina pacifica TaxID=1296415 RepID=UPI0004707EA3|nr:response regulator transcription factor [Aquimarina pacifica]